MLIILLITFTTRKKYYFMMASFMLNLMGLDILAVFFVFFFFPFFPEIYINLANVQFKVVLFYAINLAYFFYKLLFCGIFVHDTRVVNYPFTVGYKIEVLSVPVGSLLIRLAIVVNSQFYLLHIFIAIWKFTTIFIERRFYSVC